MLYKVIILHTRSSTINSTGVLPYYITCPLHALHARPEIGSPGQGSTRQTSPSMALEARIPPRQGPGPGPGPPKSLRVLFICKVQYHSLLYSTVPLNLLVHPWFTMATKAPFLHPFLPVCCSIKQHCRIQAADCRQSLHTTKDRSAKENRSPPCLSPSASPLHPQVSVCLFWSAKRRGGKKVPSPPIISLLPTTET